MRAILKMVTEITQKQFLWTIWRFLMTITRDIKIDLIMLNLIVSKYIFMSPVHS